MLSDELGRLNRLKESSRHFKDLYDIIIETEPDKPAAIWVDDNGNDCGRSFREFDKDIRAAGAFFRRRIGAENEGSFVALMMENSYRWSVTFWGLLMAGYRPVLFDATQKEPIISHLLAASGASAIIARADVFGRSSKPDLRMSSSIRSNTPASAVQDPGISQSLHPDSLPLSKTGIMHITPEEFSDAEPDASFTPRFADELALCTSGTVSTSKIYVFGEAAIIGQAIGVIPKITECPRLVEDAKDPIRHLAFLPMHHILGFMVHLILFPAVGKTVVYLKDRAPQTIQETCIRFRVTNLIVVPLLLNNLVTGLWRKVKQEGAGKTRVLKLLFALSNGAQRLLPKRGPDIAGKLVRSIQNRLLGDSIRTVLVGGSHIPVKTLETINALGYYPMPGFGMTESGLTSFETRPQARYRMAGCTGTPIVGIDYMAVDTHDRVAGSGELLIRGGSMHAARLIDGERRPPEYGEDGWFKSGDIARLEKGCLYIDGRLKEVIVNESGENIYPDELEDVFEAVAGTERLCILSLANGTPYGDISLVFQLPDNSVDPVAVAAVAAEVSARNQGLPVMKRVRRLYVAAQPLPLANGIKVRRQKLTELLETGEIDARTVDIRSGRIGQDKQGGRGAVLMPAAADISGCATGAFTPGAAPAESSAAGDFAAGDFAAGAGQSAAYADSTERSETAASVSDSENEAVMSAIRDNVVSCFSAVLSLKPDEIGHDMHFLDDLGGDSLDSLNLLVRLETYFGLMIDEREYRTCATVNDITNLIRRKQKGIVDTTQPAAEVNVTPVTDFTETQEYQAFMERLSNMSDISNPYFIRHDSVLTDVSLVNRREVLNFASYNYICMSGHPETVSAACEAARQYGTSASGSRLLAGEKALYCELEEEIAAWKHTEAALVLVGGHSTNVTFVGNFCNERDLILYDALSHNSIIQGCSLSSAMSHAFPHNDVGALENILMMSRGKFEKVLLVVEGVYSMDGDIAPIREFVRLKKEYGLFLMVDEAHSACVIGETGGGVDEYFALDPADIDIKMGTLSKGLGACGGYLAGSSALIEYLRYNIPGFVFSVGISPPVAAAALTALRLLRSDPSPVEALKRNISCFVKAACDAGLNICLAGETAIIPILVGDETDAFKLSAMLLERGISVPPAVYPAVPMGKSRLRFCVTSSHKEEQINFAIAELKDAAKQAGISLPGA